MQTDGGYEGLSSNSRLHKYLGAGATGGPSSSMTQRPGGVGMSTLSANAQSFIPQFAQLRLQQQENGVPGQERYPENDSSYMGEAHGGTVYYYPQGAGPPGAGGFRMPGAYDAGLSPSEVPISPETHSMVNVGGCFAYTGPPPHVGRFRLKTAAGNVNVAQFISPDLKLELMNRQLAMKARPDQSSYPDLPQAVEHMREIVPLESVSKAQNVGMVQSVYKATSLRDGVPYVLRRVHGLRVQNPKVLMAAETWKKLNVVHVVQLREVFSTRAFGDNSLVFVYDYHPLSETLKTRHFGRSGGGGGGGMVDVMSGAKISSPHSAPGIGGAGVPEAQLWQYVVQLSAALRSIHATGLAARCLDASKVIVQGKTKVMLAACGIQEVVAPDHQQMQTLQSEDLMSLGRLILALATGNISAGRRDLVQMSMGYVQQHYSTDMKNLIAMLLGTSQRKSVSDVMPMVGARFYHHIESLQMRVDIVENELSRELENGRLFRLLCKLNTIVERPEHNMDAQWSETGDRFLVKLFRDYVFHQVTESGKPWMDMAHIVQCLNKLDAGVQEKIELVSRDQDNIIIVSYADLKRCVETSFRELANSTVIPPPQIGRH